MTWYTDHRMQWIAESLRIFGYINRGHIQQKFGLSQPQASADLRAFEHANPDLVEYDVRRKCYVSKLAAAAPMQDKPAPDARGGEAK